MSPRCVESNQHSLSFELQSTFTTVPSKSSSQDDVLTPDSGLPTEADVLSSPGNPPHTSSRVTDVTGDSIPSSCTRDAQSSDAGSTQAPILQFGQTTLSSVQPQEQQSQGLEMPYKFGGGFPSTAFRISPMSGIFERLLPLQSFRHFSSASSSDHPNSEHHCPSTEAGEVMDLGLDLDDEASGPHACDHKMEEMSVKEEGGGHERSATVDPPPGKMVEGDYDKSHSSFLALDVEGLLMGACSSKSDSKGGVWAKYPNRVELSSEIDVERAVLGHRTEQKRKRPSSKRTGGASWRDETDKAGARDVVKKND